MYNDNNDNKFSRRSKTWFANALESIQKNENMENIDMDFDMNMKRDRDEEKETFDLSPVQSNSNTNKENINNNNKVKAQQHTHTHTHKHSPHIYDDEIHEFESYNNMQQQQPNNKFLCAPEPVPLQDHTYNINNKNQQGHQLGQILAALEPLQHQHHNQQARYNINMNSPSGTMINSALIGSIAMGVSSPMNGRKNNEQKQEDVFIFDEFNFDAYREIACLLSGKKFKINNGNSPAINQRCIAHTNYCKHGPEFDKQFPVSYSPTATDDNRIQLVIRRVNGKYVCDPLAFMFKRYHNIRKNKILPNLKASFIIPQSVYNSDWNWNRYIIKYNNNNGNNNNNNNNNWPCQQCTFINIGCAKQCKICGLQRNRNG
eukprot:100474_1